MLMNSSRCTSPSVPKFVCGCKKAVERERLESLFNVPNRVLGQEKAGNASPLSPATSIGDQIKREDIEVRSLVSYGNFDWEYLR